MSQVHWLQLSHRTSRRMFVKDCDSKAFIARSFVQSVSGSRWSKPYVKEISRISAFIICFWLSLEATKKQEKAVQVWYLGHVTPLHVCLGRCRFNTNANEGDQHQFSIHSLSFDVDHSFYYEDCIIYTFGWRTTEAGGKSRHVLMVRSQLQICWTRVYVCGHSNLQLCFTAGSSAWETWAPV